MRRILLVATVLACCALGAFVAFKWTQRRDNAFWGVTFTHGTRASRVVALTYDDGPNPPYTDEILATLRREHVHATFFVVGRAVVAHPDVIRREARDGNAIENHSWAHEHLLLESPSALHQSLLKTSAAIAKITGVVPTLMRPPFGQRDFSVLRAIHDANLIPVLWSVPLAYDWEDPAPSVIARRILANVHPGDILVLHDGNRGEAANREPSVIATEIIIRALKARGYGFVTVPELMHMSCHQPVGIRPRGCAADRDGQSGRTASARDHAPSRP